VIDLYRNKANRKRVIGILEKRNPKLVVFNGHGGEDFVAGHDNEVILKNDDEEAVSSKIIFARSCKSAKVLGATAIKRGAIAYLGYKEDFWLVYNILQISRPLEDKTAALFLEPSNYVPRWGQNTAYHQPRPEHRYRETHGQDCGRTQSRSVNRRGIQRSLAARRRGAAPANQGLRHLRDHTCRRLEVGECAGATWRKPSTMFG